MGLTKMRAKFVTKLVLGCGLILFSLSTTAQQGTSNSADIVFFNGNVLTVDTDEGDFTVAEGLAIRDGLIQAVGDENARVRQAAHRTLMGLTRRTILIDPDAPREDYLGLKTQWEVWWNITEATFQIDQGC